MSLSPSWAVQKAIFSALNTNIELTALLGAGRIYDHAPENAPFPFMVFAQSIESDWGTSSDDGREHTIVLHVWSAKKGQKEARAISERVRAILHDTALTLDENHLVNLQCRTIEVLRMPEDRATQAIIRLRAVTEPAAV